MRGTQQSKWSPLFSCIESSVHDHLSFTMGGLYCLSPGFYIILC